MMLSIFIHPTLSLIKEANLELSPGSIITAHDGGRVHLGLSFHQKWVASAGSDGRLFLRLAEHPVSMIKW